jgi:coproporphyrinogen III oxidase-like Fe-S oxidoreductase
VQFKEQGALAYFTRLRREIRLVTDHGFRFDELYVGGGTPTVLPGELRSTIELVRKLHSVGPISVETNPDDLEKDSVRRLREAGVNRLSVGVQSFDDNLLREMQRYEKYGSGDDIRGHLRRTKGAFDTINVDMIFNFPHQTEASLQRDLDILIDDVGVDQVSFYPLMAAQSTLDSMRQHMGKVGYSRERLFYHLIVGRMVAAGYVRISAWCFSRKADMADEYIVDREDYLGLGSGAFSYLNGTLMASPFSISRYKELIDGGRFGGTRGRKMSQREQMRYYLLMQLFGGSLDIALAERRFGGRFRRKLWAELGALKVLGAIEDSGDALTLTESGYYLWVVLMREFFAGINNLREQMKKRSPAAA